MCFNPYRVFSSAETFSREHPPDYLILVSIPIGFSHQLRPGGCIYLVGATPVSIPIGFSHQLRPLNNPAIHQPTLVSIPIGFSHQLRPWSGCAAGVLRGCFNPYRVFSSAETTSAKHPIHMTTCFNPYRVFSSAETLINATVERRILVSIPIGFSHQLRPRVRSIQSI